MSAPAASDPRDVAREILHEHRFHRSLGHPLRGPLHALGEWLKPIGHWFRHAFDTIDHAIPGGPWIVWLLIAAVVAWISFVVARHTIQRAAPADGEGSAGAGAGDGGPSRRDLEREADRAQREGRYEEAVRLRFGAGLLTLAQRGVIEQRSSLRSAEVAATLKSDPFDGVSRAFDEVVYGGREALDSDAQAARTGWDDVLREARR